MKYKTLAVAIAAAFTWGNPVLADMTVEERLERMEKRLRYLEQRVQSQDAVIREKDRTIAELQDRQDDMEPRWRRVEKQLDDGEPDGRGWFQSVEVGGLVEVEAGWTDPYTGDDESDIVLATVELGIGSQINDWTRADILFLHEEDETELEVDVGTITIADPDGPWALTAGQFYLPFGVFETRMVSDPLTLELGEIRESAVMAGVEAGGFSAGAFVFNGENDTGGDEDIDNWGAVAGYTAEGDGIGFSANVGFLSDLGDSDALQDTVVADTAAIANDPSDARQAMAAARLPVLQARRDDVNAWFATAVVTSGPFTFIGEYLAATDAFAADELTFGDGGAEPEAWGLEAGIGFDLAGRDASFALGLQGTDDAVALGLPEERILATLSVAIMENTALSFEWAHDEDYDQPAGGTGAEADTVTAQLAVEF